MTFAEAWDFAGNIEGWFSHEEAATLFEAAQAAPPGTMAVEIGSYCGRSTAVLAAAGLQTWAVDPMEDMCVVGKDWPIALEHIESLKQVVRHFDNLEWFRGTSVNVGPPPCLVGLLHIDGCHFDPWPLRDFSNFELSLAPGAHVLFHDVADAPDVRQTVDMLVGQKRLQHIRTVGSLCELVFPG